jgi:very-short-patch-repair endonuclease
VADFCCVELRLVVEIDGAAHSEPAQVAHDENRTAYLESLGYQVLRFSNSEVLESPEAVLTSIHSAAQPLYPKRRAP